MDLLASLRDAQPAVFRAMVRSGRFVGPTAGLVRGYAQANVVILPARWAGDFEAFCRNNPKPCPLIAQTAPGDPEPRSVAIGADLRTDVPRYRVFRYGQPDRDEPTDIRSLWRDDLVGFLLGCSFTFEQALEKAGLEVRHLRLRRNVPMYHTRIACRPAGKFCGPLVVSMRPFAPADIPRVRAITAEFPTMHGEPIHVGDPAALGIADLGQPDYGDPVELHEGEVPVFWACGVTPQLALAEARPELCITHSPGAMFVTDRTDQSFRRPR